MCCALKVCHIDEEACTSLLEVHSADDHTEIDSKLMPVFWLRGKLAIFLEEARRAQTSGVDLTSQAWREIAVPADGGGSKCSQCVESQAAL